MTVDKNGTTTVKYKTGIIYVGAMKDNKK